MKRASILTLILIFEFIVLSVSLMSYVPHAASEDISSEDSSIVMDLPAGWNMISLPVIPKDTYVSSLFPGTVLVYKYNRQMGYVRVPESENLEVGKGYWILLDNPRSYVIRGAAITDYNISVKDGWYMIGGGYKSSQGFTI